MSVMSGINSAPIVAHINSMLSFVGDTPNLDGWARMIAAILDRIGNQIFKHFSQPVRIRLQVGQIGFDLKHGPDLFQSWFIFVVNRPDDRKRIHLAKLKANSPDPAQVQQIINQLPHPADRTINAVDRILCILSAPGLQVLAKNSRQPLARHDRTLQVVRHRIEKLLHLLVLRRKLGRPLFDNSFKLSVNLSQFPLGPAR